MLEETERDPTIDAATARAGVAGLLLCGGESRRMGRDKARLAFEGRPLAHWPLASLREVADEVLLASGKGPRYGDFGHREVFDPVPDGGPLAGLAAGLGATTREWLVVLACDMPRVEPDLLRALVARARETGADVCLAKGENGAEPLCGVYRRTCLRPVEAALAAGERRMVAFWHYPRADGGRVHVASATASELSAASNPAVNVNTPEDLERVGAAARAPVSGCRGAVE